MNRIDKLFTEKQSDILSIYYPAGYPTIEDTMPILRELQCQGIDMVEIGIPFSDPMADGVVIQNAATKALENGISLKKLFSQIEQMRSEIQIPVILMGYLNPIMRFGFERFCQECGRTGVDGVIIPDLPLHDYIADFKEIANHHNLKMIMFISPETSSERIKVIDKEASGFIYMVSSAGTTGAKADFSQSQHDYFRRINEMKLKNPRMIGFGISNQQTYRAATGNAQGAIVGSHFVKILGEEGTIQSKVERLISSLNPHCHASRSKL